MRKIFIFTLILATGVFAYLAWAEEITFSTYYSAPGGVYKGLTTTQDTYLATESGNVGIGTEDPKTKLEVNNVLRLTPAGTPPIDFSFEGPADYAGSIYYDDTLNRFKYCDGTVWRSF